MQTLFGLIHPGPSFSFVSSVEHSLPLHVNLLWSQITWHCYSQSVTKQYSQIAKECNLHLWKLSVQPCVWYLYILHAMLYRVIVLPGNAPQGFNALDCRVFYVLKGQTPRNFGPIDSQTDLHCSCSCHRWCREAHNLRHSPPGGSTKREIYSWLWLWLPTRCCSGKSLTSCSYCMTHAHYHEGRGFIIVFPVSLL